jgi:hypothetical protein
MQKIRSIKRGKCRRCPVGPRAGPIIFQTVFFPFHLIFPFDEAVLSSKDSGRRSNCVSNSAGYRLHGRFRFSCDSRSDVSSSTTVADEPTDGLQAVGEIVVDRIKVYSEPGTESTVWEKLIRAIFLRFMR